MSLRALVLKLIIERPLLPSYRIKSYAMMHYPCQPGSVAVELWRLKKKGLISAERFDVPVDKAHHGYQVTEKGKRFYKTYFTES